MLASVINIQHLKKSSQESLIMPAMPRCDKKAEKIAFDIMGTPPNMRNGNNNQRDKKQSDIKERLDFEETTSLR